MADSAECEYTLGMGCRSGVVIAALVLSCATFVKAKNAPAAGARPVVRTDVRHDTSPPLRAIEPAKGRSEAGEMPAPGPLPGRRPAPGSWSDATGVPDDVPVTREPMPPPLFDFEGISNVDGAVPPDTVGDVGPGHIVEWVNRSWAVYDRAGNLLLGPVAGNTLWSGFGGTCETSNAGDPVVQYDQLADRWLVSQLGFTWPHDFHQCVAVSATPDPTGTWHRYDFFFHDDNLNDYPKIGVWPDAYYLAVNQFVGDTQSWRGQGALAFERQAMLAGGPARMVYFDLYDVNPDYGGMLPGDLDGPIAPPDGTPNPFVEVDDDAWWPAEDRLSIWRFHVDWSAPELSTFGNGGDPDAFIDLTAAGASFDADVCGYARSCIPQPGGTGLDALSDRLMWRLAYRAFGTRDALVVNHTIDVDGLDHAGVRWYEIGDPAGTPVLAQAGTLAPDPDHRWMASAAMDGAGDLALAYNVSSTVTFPSIRYSGRRADDPPGTLPLEEAVLVDGTGTQNSASRWGDYSTLVVDPTDDCTFWYFGQYLADSGDYPWRTRVGSFRIEGCGQCPLVGGPELTAEPDPGGVRLAWLPTEHAGVYDVVSGDLGTLRATDGDFAASLAQCGVDDTAATEAVLIGPEPLPGEGAWYLVRGVSGVCRGTWDGSGPSQVVSRDAGVHGALGACP